MFSNTLDKKQIYFEVIGNYTSSKTIIFLNGLSQTTVSWGLVTPSFINDYKIILCDFIFQGQSDKDSPVRDFDTHAKDVLSIIDLLGIEKSTIIGLSYGSLVAQHFSTLFPDRIDKMVLLSTFAHKTPYYEAIELSWKNALKIGGYSLMLDVMLPYVLSDVYFSNPVIPIEFFKSSKKDVVDANSLTKLMQATADRKDYRESLKKVLCPTLVIHGRLDGLFPVNLGQEVANQIKNSKFTIIENAGHTLNIEKVNKVSSTILDFLDESIE